MDEMEYRTTVMVLKTACGREEFESFIKNGVNKAKGVIIQALAEKPAGLSYFQLENLVKEFFLNEKGETAVWKMDSFIVALAGLELEDKRIKHKLGIYTLLNKELEGGKNNGKI